MNNLLKVLSVVFVLIVAIFAPISIHRNNVENDRYVQMCVKKGGIPITSEWDGRLKDCLIFE